MPSTFLCLHYHAVFSTKNREPSLQKEWRPRVHEYLGGIVNGLGARSGMVGGAADHVHILFELKATHCLADFMREVKKASSMWIHNEMKVGTFAWQEGYATFTAAASGLERIRRYIENQEEHHRHRTFRDELKIMLKRSGVKFEDRYLD